MIGLVDYDFQTEKSINLHPPNIQIMKLASYYKREENKFCKLVSLDDSDPDAYEKIYFFSQQEKYPNIPQNFLRASNVTYGGTAVTNGLYIPFKNSIIDYTIPRTHVYSEILKQKYNDGIRANIIKHILDDTYYRMYAGNNRLPIPPIIPKKRVYLYDVDIFYPEWKEILNTIIERKPTAIFCIHPIRCTTITQYSLIRNYPKFARTNKIILDLNVPLDQIYYLLKVYKKMFIADITTNSNVCIPIGGSFKTATQYRRDLIYKLNLLYSFWSVNIPIKTFYQYPKMGFKNPLANLEKKIEAWSNNLLKEKKTINEYLQKKNKTIEEIELDELIKFIPSGKNLFNQTSTSIKNGGIWRI